MLDTILKRSNFWDVLIVLLSATAIIGIWRGIWNLLDKYLLVDNFIWSQLASIFCGILILVLLSKWGGWRKSK